MNKKSDRFEYSKQMFAWRETVLKIVEFIHMASIVPDKMVEQSVEEFLAMISEVHTLYHDNM
jgi:hypothetical protein